MPVSKAQQKAVHKYVKENYDRMEITVPKGQKEIIKAHAEARGESVNGFLNRAVSETMERDKAAPETAGKATEPCLHTQEQAVRRILYRHKMHLKKTQEGRQLHRGAGGRQPDLWHIRGTIGLCPGIG